MGIIVDTMSPIMSRMATSISSFNVRVMTRWKPVGAFVRMAQMIAIVKVGNVQKLSKIR